MDDFSGTARYYARYRVPYPPALLDDLLRRAGVGHGGRLLDLGCGPGRVALALALAPRFAEVWAVDPEPEMIAEGRAQARQAQADNLRWLTARAEDLEAPNVAFDLITIGEAFHRFDRPLIARRALAWLKPGACLAALGCFGITRGNEAWQAVLRRIVEKWTSKEPGFHASKRGAGHDEQVLTAAGFDDVASHTFMQPHDWTLASIVGNLHSTSTCSPSMLGDKVEAFEADLKRALLDHDPSGIYRETLRFGYTLARRPAP